MSVIMKHETQSAKHKATMHNAQCTMRMIMEHEHMNMKAESWNWKLEAGTSTSTSNLEFGSWQVAAKIGENEHNFYCNMGYYKLDWTGSSGFDLDRLDSARF